MNHTYDFGETLPIRIVYRDSGSGAIADQSTVTVTITDPDGTKKVTDSAMSEESSATYTYTYAIPLTGPEGTWKYVTTGTDASGVLTINTVYFDVKAIVSPHSRPDDVREILPELLMSEDHVGVISSGTTLTLTNPALGVPSILKNTDIIYESTNYAFKQPQTVTLSVAATGENFIAHTHIGFSNAQLIKYIARSDRKINNLFANLTAPTSSYALDWSAMLTASYVLKITSHGNPDTLNWARSLENVVMSDIEAYKTNTGRTAFNDDGVTRADATAVDGFNLDQSGSAGFEGI